MKPRLFDKIGIDAERLCWAHMPDGMEVGGGLFATTEDNLRLMKLYADGGVWDGERILSEEYVKLAVSLQNESATESEVNPEHTIILWAMDIRSGCADQRVYTARTAPWDSLRSWTPAGT